MKPLFLLVLALGMISACQKTVPYSPREIDFSRAPPDHSVTAFGGTLLGYDAGEWGGKLVFRDSSGNVSDVLKENIQAIVPRGNNVVVFTGLSHLTINEGYMYLLIPDKQHGFKLTKLKKLDGAPKQVQPDSQSGVINFLIYTGANHVLPGGWIYDCRVLTVDYRVTMLPGCHEPQP